MTVGECFSDYLFFKYCFFYIYLFNNNVEKDCHKYCFFELGTSCSETSNALYESYPSGR